MGTHDLECSVIQFHVDDVGEAREEGERRLSNAIQLQNEALLGPTGLGARDLQGRGGTPAVQIWYLRHTLVDGVAEGADRLDWRGGREGGKGGREGGKGGREGREGERGRRKEREEKKGEMNAEQAQPIGLVEFCIKTS